MKKRVSIYIDEGVWEVAKDAARERSVIEKRSVSASQVIENCILGMTENPVEKRFREIGEDVREHMKNSNARKALFETSHKDPEGTPVSEIENTAVNYQKVVNDSYNEQVILAEAQKKLEAKKVELGKSIKTPKGPVRANVAMDNFFNPMSKDRQLGKKKGVV